MYTISVRWSDDVHERATYSGVQEYEIRDGVLTMAFSEDHDVILPLYQVTTIDVVRQK